MLEVGATINACIEKLKEADALQLRQWVSAFGTPQQVALRSRIVLAAAEGQSDNAIAANWW